MDQGEVLLDAEPPHVSIIFDEELRVRAWTKEIRSAIAAAGFRSSRGRRGLTVRFEAGEDHVMNPALIHLLQELSSVGVAFSRDFKQFVSPAEHVEMLIERGHSFDSPKGCGFNGEVWLTHDLPVPG